MEGLLNTYNRAATEAAASGNKDLAKAIYESMINACNCKGE